MILCSKKDQELQHQQPSSVDYVLLTTCVEEEHEVEGIIAYDAGCMQLLCRGTNIIEIGIAVRPVLHHCTGCGVKETNGKEIKN